MARTLVAPANHLQLGDEFTLSEPSEALLRFDDPILTETLSARQYRQWLCKVVRAYSANYDTTAADCALVLEEGVR